MALARYALVSCSEKQSLFRIRIYPLDIMVMKQHSSHVHFPTKLDAYIPQQECRKQCRFLIQCNKSNVVQSNSSHNNPDTKTHHIFHHHGFQYIQTLLEKFGQLEEIEYHPKLVTWNPQYC